MTRSTQPARRDLTAPDCPVGPARRRKHDRERRTASTEGSSALFDSQSHTPWGVWVGAGEECVECHADVEAFSCPSAVCIRCLALMGCDSGRVAGGRGLSGADATAAGVVQLEPVGCAYRFPSAFVEAVVMESA
jgi:hypothetical protein